MVEAPGTREPGSKERARAVADAARRGARDVASTVRDRLARAPNLAHVGTARIRIEAATTALAEARAAVASAVAKAGETMADASRHHELVQAMQKQHRTGAPADTLVARSFRELPLHLAASFNRDRHVGFSLDQTRHWQDWTASNHPQAMVVKGVLGMLLRWGSYNPASDDQLLFSALPLIGSRPWVILSDAASEEQAHELLRALVLRLACMLPQQSRFTLLDPLHYGQTFPMQRYLPAVRETGADLAQDLQRIQADVRRIIRDVVAFHGSFEALPAEQQANERYEFVVAADFPKATQYDRRVSEMLLDIGRAGPKAGRYLILHVVDGAPLPHGLSLDQLGDAWRIDLRGEASPFADTAPPPQMQQALLERVRTVAPTRRSAGFADILPPVARWWTGRSARRVEATLDGRKDGLEIVFGQRDDGAESVHAVLAAMAGTGKSNLLHALLLGLATRYPPEELQLYLLDLKQGVEFQPYGRLPHAAVVAYNTDPALARAVLSELRQEMQRRYEALFRPSGVQKLEDYRNAGDPRGPAPRILLVVDEYQALFQDVGAQEVSGDLLALSTQGRAAGIHMLLGSQTFRAVGMQGSEQIFNNINIRMGMGMPAAAVQALTEFEREGKELIRSCDLPGKVVLNSSAGRDGDNRLGQVVLVSPAERDAALDRMTAMAAEWPESARAHWPRTQVFDGSHAPTLAAHGLRRVAGEKGALAGPAALAGWAMASKPRGGLGRPEWRTADRPVPLLLGREYAVFGEAACVLRRLPNQNMLLLGGSASARLGMLAGIGASIAALSPEVLATVRVLDLSGDAAVAAVLAPGDGRVTVSSDPASAPDLLAGGAGGQEGADLLLLIEPDRALELLRPSDPMTRAPTIEALEKRLREGPQSGRHTLLVCNGLAALGRVLGRRGANHFAWRAVTQMSQEDSQDLLGNRQAAQLRGDARGGPEPALLADIDANRFTRFMPYGV